MDEIRKSIESYNLFQRQSVENLGDQEKLLKAVPIGTVNKYGKIKTENGWVYQKKGGKAAPEKTEEKSKKADISQSEIFDKVSPLNDNHRYSHSRRASDKLELMKWAESGSINESSFNKALWPFDKYEGPTYKEITSAENFSNLGREQQLNMITLEDAFQTLERKTASPTDKHNAEQVIAKFGKAYQKDSKSIDKKSYDKLMEKYGKEYTEADLKERFGFEKKTKGPEVKLQERASNFDNVPEKAYKARFSKMAEDLFPNAKDVSLTRTPNKISISATNQDGSTTNAIMTHDKWGQGTVTVTSNGHKSKKETESKMDHSGPYKVIGDRGMTYGELNEFYDTAKTMV